MTMGHSGSAWSLKHASMPPRPTCCSLAIAGCNLDSPRQLWDAGSLPMALSYYLLGFSHFENDTFLGPLLRSLHPRARAYVINVDDFFLDHASDPGNDVMYGLNTRARYDTKRTWQTAHRIVCTWQPSLCGNAMSFYRQRDTGEWRLGWGWASNRLFEQTDPRVDYDGLTRMKPIAEKFISDLGVDRSCVFLTYVPCRQ